MWAPRPAGGARGAPPMAAAVVRRPCPPLLCLLSPSPIHQLALASLPSWLPAASRGPDNTVWLFLTPREAFPGVPWCASPHSTWPDQAPAVRTRVWAGPPQGTQGHAVRVVLVTEFSTEGVRPLKARDAPTLYHPNSSGTPPPCITPESSRCPRPISTLTARDTSALYHP